MDAAECTACGRWASIFDLERGAGDDRAAAYAPAPARTRVPEAEPVVMSEPHSSTAERARRVFDVLREAGEQEAEPEHRSTGSLLRWVFVALAVFWFVVVPLLDQLR